MEFEQTPRAAPLHRPLIAADPDIDPHRLVAVCCQHAGDEPLSVSLLIPVDDDARPWSESTARAERLLRDVDVLLGAAGIDLEEVVSARHDTESHGVLRLAARPAREQGLEVIAGGRPLDHPGWLRRVLSPLFHWPHPRERAA